MTRSDGCRPEVISSRSVKPVGTPVTSLLAGVQLLDGIEAALREVAERRETVAHLAVGDRENRVLGLIEDDVGVFLGLIRVRQDFVGREDQTAERRLFLDDARVVLDVGRARHAIDKGGNVGGATDRIDFTGPLQFVLERDQVDGVAAFGELDHLLEDAPVRIAEEVVGVDHFGREVERVVVQQDGPEH